MYADNTLINKMKQNFGQMTTYYRRWLISAGGVCLSVSALFSTSAFADDWMNWNSTHAIKALGHPVVHGKDNNGKPVRYPPVGTSNLLGVLPSVVEKSFPQTGKPNQLKDVIFWVKAKHNIFIVPHVVTGKYTCKMSTQRKDGSGGQATLTLSTDAVVENQDYASFKGDTKVMESYLTDLVYSVRCNGTGFSWERQPNEKVRFEKTWENPVPSIEMQDKQIWIHNVAFWSPPDNVSKQPNGEFFNDPAILATQEKVKP